MSTEIKSFGKSIINVPEGASVIILPPKKVKSGQIKETNPLLNITKEETLREFIQNILSEGEENALLGKAWKGLTERLKLAAVSGVDFNSEFLPDFRNKMLEIGRDIEGSKIGMTSERLKSIGEVVIREAEDIWTTPVNSKS